MLTDDPERGAAALSVGARAAFAEFFSMFEVPFRYGAPWNTAEDQAHASVVVISRALNEKLFDGADSVGQTLRMGNQAFRIVGVLKAWNPVPRYYDLEDTFARTPDDVFLPFNRAIDLEKQSAENIDCMNINKPGWQSFLNSDCVWIGFWVQLPNPTAVASYRRFLLNYAAEQEQAGRFHWPPRVRLRDVQQWLVYHHVVSDEARILMLVSFAFLFVCLLNAMSLMLAKTMRRVGVVGVRRALGAGRGAVFAQIVIEAVTWR